MSFTLHFNSNVNTGLLDISILDELAKCKVANKFNSIVFDSNFDQPIPKLPAFIKHVEFGFYFNNNIIGIGDHIETCKFKVEKFNYDLSTFPKGLRKLEIIDSLITSKIENINPCLETLIITNHTFNDKLNLKYTNITLIEITSTEFNQSLTHLPLGLKTFEINCDSFNNPMDNLPSGLEVLKISSSSFNQPMNNLPSKLKTLILQNLKLFMQPLNNLPYGLEHFDLHLGYYYDETSINIYKHTLEHLPNSIRKMALANYWGDLNTICDGVVELEVCFPPNKSDKAIMHIQHWQKLPSSLKKLDINKFISIVNKKHNIADIIKSNINLKDIYLNGVLM